MANKNSRPLFVEIGHGLSLMTGLLVISSWDSKGRPRKPKLGTFGFNSETSDLEYWDGKTWLKAAMS